jgi:two-component system NarL family response regulator
MKILLVDDHALFLQSLKGLLVTSGYTVVGTAQNGLEALAQARVLRPDLILMDIEMPQCDGLAAVRLIKAEIRQVKIVMLTVSTSDADLFEAIKSGATGYLLKSQSADQFLELIAQVEQGGAALPPELAMRLLEEFARRAQNIEQAVDESPADLTDRQVEVLTLVAQGLTYGEIGEILHLSEATIRYHMSQILARLHLENRSQVIAYAARHGLGRSTAS